MPGQRALVLLAAAALLAAGTVAGHAQSDALIELPFRYGANAAGPLVEAPDGNFYVAADSVGANGTGAIYQLTPDGDSKLIYTFCALDPGAYTNADGADPSGGLLVGRDGNLYGTTGTGGPNGVGTVYRVTTSGSFYPARFF